MSKIVYSAAARTLAGVLADARREAGLHQAQLAARLGKDQSVISHIERGHRKVDVLELYAIARALGLDPVQLFARIVAAFPAKVDV